MDFVGLVLECFPTFAENKNECYNYFRLYNQ